MLLLAAICCAGCGGAHGPRLVVTPRVSLLDAPLAITVAGVQPHALVTLTVHENGWSSRASFRADAHGRVDPAVQRPLGGSYAGVAPMGLFWSLHGPDALGGPWIDGEATLAATVHGKTVAQAGFERLAQADGVASRGESVAENGFYGRYFAPPRRHDLHVPVLIFGGSEGGLSTTLEGGLLASHGFPTLSLAYFAAPGLPASLERIPLEYFVRAARFLDRQPGVDARRLVVIGASRGAEAALLLASYYPRLVAGVVGLSPSSFAKEGYDAKRLRTGVPAWTVHGRAIPYRSAAHPAAGAIPVYRITADVFLSAGLEDQLTLGFHEEQEITPRLRPIKGRRVVSLVYEHAGHLVDTPVPYLPWGDTDYVAPLGVQETLGGTPFGNAAARADEWPRLLAFIATVWPRG